MNSKKIVASSLIVDVNYNLQQALRRHYMRFVELRAMALEFGIQGDPIGAMKEVPLAVVSFLNDLTEELPIPPHQDPAICELHIVALSLWRDTMIAAIDVIETNDGFKSMTPDERRENNRLLREAIQWTEEVREDEEKTLRLLESGIQLADVGPAFDKLKIKFS